jgi:hypothetical protein
MEASSEHVAMVAGDTPELGTDSGDTKNFAADFWDHVRTKGRISL